MGILKQRRYTSIYLENHKFTKQVNTLIFSDSHYVKQLLTVGHKRQNETPNR